MSDSDRNYLAALAGLALFFPLIFGAFSSVSNQSDQQRYQPYRYAADELQGTESAPLADTHAKALEYRRPCEQPKGHDESDLCAQWKAANAAEENALWAKWSLWITAAGAIGLLVTIIQGRIALERASEANRIAEEASHRQARAYLFVKSITVQYGLADADNYDLVMQIHNAGTTPGEVKRVAIIAQWFGHDGAEDIVNHEGEVGTKCFFDTPHIMPFPFLEGALLQGKGFIVVMGRIEYSDVFGKNHTEPFAFRTFSDRKISFEEHDLPYKLASFPLSTLSLIGREWKAGKSRPAQRTANDGKRRREGR